VNGEDKVSDRDRIGSARFSLNKLIAQAGREHFLPLVHQSRTRLHALQSSDSAIFVRATSVSLLTEDELQDAAAAAAAAYE
jgi:hypothetical protein